MWTTCQLEQCGAWHRRNKKHLCWVLSCVGVYTSYRVVCEGCGMERCESLWARRVLILSPVRSASVSPLLSRKHWASSLNAAPLQSFVHTASRLQAAVSRVFLAGRGAASRRTCRLSFMWRGFAFNVEPLQAASSCSESMCAPCSMGGPVPMPLCRRFLGRPCSLVRACAPRRWASIRRGSP